MRNPITIPAGIQSGTREGRNADNRFLMGNSIAIPAGIQSGTQEDREAGHRFLIP